MSASSPGCASVQAPVAVSPLRPALQPMPTTSRRAQCRLMPISLISRAENPGVMNPVEETQHR